jgi:hypothetical protein
MNPAIYSSDRFWPEGNIRNTKTGSKSGFTLVSFLVYPVRYNPVSGEIEVTENFDITVTWDEGSPAVLSSGQITGAASQLSGWIDNPEMLFAFAPVAGNRDNVDYIVITTADYSDSFTAFTAFKTTQGFQAEMVYVEDITASTPGYDNPEKIRNYIIDRFWQDGLQYVLLAGDQTVVPVRTVGLSCEGYTDNAPSDLYYSDLDGTWDESGDHNYGQPNDSLDLYADVAVGRALFDTPEEAALFVQRTIMYETAPPPGDWTTTAMLCGGGLFSGYTGAKVCDSIAVNLPGDWQINKAYETAKSSDGYTTHIEVINTGTNWVHYAGHGDTTGIYWQGYPSSMMTNSIAQGLVNGNMAGIHHSIGCHPGAFQSGECCAEALLHNPGGGAVSVMFNTSYGWEGYLPEMGVSEWMCVYLTEEVFQLGNTMIGNAFATAKDRRVPLWSGGYDRELYCILDWHGYHDPALIPAGSSTVTSEAEWSLLETSSVVLGMPSPNPVSSGSSVCFTVLLTGSSELSIYDLSGRMIWTTALENSGSAVWNTGAEARIPPGVYFARLSRGEAVSVQKVIVTR